MKDVTVFSSETGWVGGGSQLFEFLILLRPKNCLFYKKTVCNFCSAEKIECYSKSVSPANMEGLKRKNERENEKGKGKGKMKSKRVDFA